MQTWTQKLLIACLVINTLVTLALFSMLWSVRGTVQRVERDFHKLEEFASGLAKDADTAKGKAGAAYERYKQWRETRDREQEQR